MLVSPKNSFHFRVGNQSLSMPCQFCGLLAAGVGWMDRWIGGWTDTQAKLTLLTSALVENQEGSSRSQ